MRNHCLVPSLSGSKFQIIFRDLLYLYVLEYFFLLEIAAPLLRLLWPFSIYPKFRTRRTIIVDGPGSLLALLPLGYSPDPCWGGAPRER